MTRQADHVYLVRERGMRIERVDIGEFVHRHVDTRGRDRWVVAQALRGPDGQVAGFISPVRTSGRVTRMPVASLDEAARLGFSFTRRRDAARRARGVFDLIAFAPGRDPYAGARRRS